jgi:hypothetical protein
MACLTMQPITNWREVLQHFSMALSAAFEILFARLELAGLVDLANPAIAAKYGITTEELIASDTTGWQMRRSL